MGGGGSKNKVETQEKLSSTNSGRLKDEDTIPSNVSISKMVKTNEDMKRQIHEEKDKYANIQNNFKYLKDNVIKIINNSNDILEGSKKPKVEGSYSKSNSKSPIATESDNVSDVKNIVKQLQCVMNEFQKKNKELKEKVKLLEDELQKQRKEKLDITHKISEEMNAKVGQNESSLENISVKNRPMTITDDYRKLCANSWLSAKQTLDEVNKDKNVNEETNTKLLANILLVAGEEASKNVQKMWQDLEQATSSIICEPLTNKEKKKESKSTLDLIPRLQIGLWDDVRNQADKVDISTLITAITDNKHIQKSKKLLKKPDVQNYIMESGRLAWKMVLQRPPMTFQLATENEKWCKEMEREIEPAWGSNVQDNAACVRYCIHPILLHGDKILVKGKALIK